jgi:A/G-specific adenine glycosylase
LRNYKIIQKQLLSWYRREKRDLPWRATKDAYSIWVSEIMLQQTQVNTVIPYYQRWLRSFPSVQNLAEAEERDVLKHWQGLGYYSRARNLHRAAKIVADDFQGEIPDTLDGIQRLPGIGLYTAGAILSIAYGKRVPVLDGNVKRVLARLFCLAENGKTSKSAQALLQVAGELLPKKHAGDFNQALMELGATVCLPRNPLCPTCPILLMCKAQKANLQDRYPPPVVRPAQNKIVVSAAVILKGKKTYIQQRPRNGLMGGLWEFPGGKMEKNETPEECLKREIQEELGVDVEIESKLMTIRHSYTQFRVTLHVYLCRLTSGRIRATQCEQWKWVPFGELESYPFPSANAKIVEHLCNSFQKTEKHVQVLEKK